MKNYLALILITILCNSNLIAQEKRIALVIGNSDYTYLPKLNNPVRDAILMAQTFESLDFDVILDTNITTEDKFIDAIFDFGTKRESYDVGFIFYAGHGMQIDGKNYLLPTEEDFKNDEKRVKQNAIGVEMVMEYLTKQTDQINVLILDACRNNPIQNTRSVGVGGLAEMQATGSLIAFSTTAGNVAKDGDGDHSIYCMSLVKNMLKEGIDIHQVFANVRKEVFQKTGQSTVDYNQLMDNAFYLKRATYTDKYLLIDSLIEKEQYEKGLEIAISILNEDIHNKFALIRKGRLYTFLEKYELAEAEFNLAKTKYPNDAEILLYSSGNYYLQGEDNKALNEINKCIHLDTNYADAYVIKSNYNTVNKNYLKAIDNLNTAISIDSTNAEYFQERAFIFEELKNFELALKDYNTAIYIDSGNIHFWYNRGDFYENFNKPEMALQDYEYCLKIDSSYVSAYNSIGFIHETVFNDNETALKFYKLGTIYDEDYNVTNCYRNIGDILLEQGKLNESLENYNKAIDKDPYDGDLYSARTNYYEKIKNYKQAYSDYSRAIELEPDNTEYLFNRGRFLAVSMSDYSGAIKDFESMLSIDSLDVNAINSIGATYRYMGQTERAIDLYSKGIRIGGDDSTAIALCYSNKADILSDLEQNKKAQECYDNAIKYDPQNYEHYNSRALFLDKINKFEEADDDFYKAIELESTDIDLRHNFGVSLYERNDERAIDVFENILEIDSTYISAINWIGVIHDDNGNPDKAIKAYEKGIALKGISPESAAYCYLNRGIKYYEQGENEKALLDFNNAVKYDNGNAHHYNTRGIFYEEIGEVQLAFKDFTKCIELDSLDANAWLDRGDFLYNNEQINKAVSDYKEVLKIDSLNLEALNNIGDGYATIGENLLALKAYNKCINSTSQNIENKSLCFSGRGSLNENQGNIINAIFDYTKAIELAPNYDWHYLIRGKLYEEIDSLFQAYHDYSKAIEIIPDNINYSTRAFLSEKMNNYSQATQDYKEAIKADPTNAENIANYALFLIRIGKQGKGIKQFENAIDLDSSNTMIYFNRAKAYKLIGYPDKAIDEYKTVIKIDPDDPEGYYYLADYHEASSNYIKAVVYFTKAIERLGGEKGYYVSDSLGKEQAQSKIYLRRATLFRKLEESEFACEDYLKALELMKDEPFYVKKEEDQNALEEKIKNLCN